MVDEEIEIKFELDNRMVWWSCVVLSVFRTSDGKRLRPPSLSTAVVRYSKFENYDEQTSRIQFIHGSDVYHLRDNEKRIGRSSWRFARFGNA